METKRKDITEEDITRWIAAWEEFKASGVHKAWCEVQETPSKGKSRKITGIKSGRIHHLLSDGEYFVFLLLEYDKS